MLRTLSWIFSVVGKKFGGNMEEKYAIRIGAKYEKFALPVRSDCT